MKLIDINTLLKIINKTSLNTFYLKLIKALEADFSRWHEFNKSARHATHSANGVIELMPCSDKQFYSFKYVNGHPSNTLENKLCVAAIGMLSDSQNGYPLMISEMTLLTALRTAATGALAAKYLARKESHHIAIIGNGAQAEFQALAFNSVFPLHSISFYDIDEQAMEKFSKNMHTYNFKLLPCSNIKQCIKNADIIVTATAAKKRINLFSIDQIKPGTHIHAMGGDCPGKTEFDKEILNQAKVVVEYLEQSLQEGEVQQGDESVVDAELWEIIQSKKIARENDSEITFFDSVGFALEDFSTLRLIYQLSEQMQLGEEVNLVPQLDNAKDLFGLLNNRGT
jgi:ornithine cyclodeaminase